MFKFLASLLRPMALALEGDSAITAILGVVGQLMTAITGFFTSLSTWIVGDSLAILYIAMMIIMFVVLVFLTILKKG